MFRLNLSKREKYIFTTACVVIMGGLSYSFIFEPLFKKWSTFDNEIVIQKAQFKKSLKLLENRNTIIRDYNSYASSVNNISQILSYIERYAESSGIKTANIQPRPAIQKEFYTEYVIELQIEGAFADINRFITQLIKPPLFISVKQFDLRIAGEGSSNFKGTVILSKLII